MNEQIKQLAEQALEYAEKNQSADIPRHWFRLYNEKFAQLIVRECAQVADTERPSSLGCGYITKTTGMRVKEHFGVKE